MDIGVGDWVECIGLSGDGVGPYREMTPRISAGTIIQVESIIDGINYDDGVDGLTFSRIPGRYPCGRRFAYSIERFRPIYRPKAEILQGLLKPIREKEPA